MSSSNPDPVTEPTREELIDLYKIALDEYRFQVDLNWNRTQYYFVLNLGIIGVATGILRIADRQGDWLVGSMYAVGLVSCFMSYMASRSQQSYYASTREHKRKVESALGLGPLSLTTTPGMGSLARRLGRVTTYNSVMLGMLGAANIAGIVGSVVE